MWIRLTALLVVSTLTVGCAASASTRPSATPKSRTVLIQNYSYHPQTLTVTAGTRVTFTNHDHTAHTATSTSGTFDTGTLHPGQSTNVVLSKPGKYTFYCQFHAFMRGVIIVR
jgi:plastocyanin